MSDTDDQVSRSVEEHQGTTNPALVVAAWVLVGIPLGYGLWETVVQASQLFMG